MSASFLINTWLREYVDSFNFSALIGYHNCKVCFLAWQEIYAAKHVCNGCPVFDEIW